MKNSALLFLACAASAGAANAQSSVTVFGILDAGVRHIKNDDTSRTLVSSGGIATSRLGFRGVENIGSGMKASFWLETQVNVDDGTIASSGKFWHRRSTVSLLGSFGELRFGRDFSPAYRVAGMADPFSDTGLAAISTQFSTASINGATYATHTRLDNAVSYFTPETLGGFSGVLTVAPGENVPGNRLYGGLLGYKAGPVQLSAGYSATRVTTDDVKNLAFAAIYDLGGPKLMGSYSELKYTAAKERHANVGGVVPAGSGQIKANYVYTEATGGNFTTDGVKNKSHKLGLGYQYDLSVRTALYTNVAYIKNEGGATYVLQAPSLTASRPSRGFDLGVRHAF